MTRVRSVFLFLVMLLAVPLAPPVAHAQEAPLKQPGRWAQDYLGRPADPAVRFGTLANGLRYAILKNDTPKDAVSMRLLIGSGSLKERDEERGLAHFLEHMVFRGSKNVADGDLVKMLERHGLRFGPDTNASTSFDRTLYMFNFPRATPEAVETGFMLFREIADRLTLAPATVEAEKGVVLSEERLRDTPPLQAAKATYGLLFQGTLVPERWPIGTVETISGATPERLRRYYLANYRPDNAVIVVVGAIDPDKIEARIRSGFSDWKASGEADRYDAVPPTPREKVAEFVADGAPDELSINWMRPLDRRAETVALAREQLARTLGVRVLNNRLGDRALKPGSPFVAAGLSLSDSLLDSSGIASMSIQADPARWRPALEAVLEEQRMLLRDGVGADELARASNAILASLQAAADGAATRRNESLADALIGAASDDELFTSPAQNLALIKELIAQETPERATAALRALFAGTPPLVFRSARADPATPAALEAGLVAAQAAVLPPPAARAAVNWPYPPFGTPGAIVSRRVDGALGATFVTFANGTRLIAKQTDYEKDRVSISLGFGNGQSGLAPALVHAGWAASLFSTGGTGKLAVPDLRNLMQTQGKLGGVQPSLGVSRFWLNGGTRPADFAFQMDLLTAFVTDPGFRPEMGEQLKTYAPMVKAQIDANPGAVFQRDLVDLLQGNDRRFTNTPSNAEIDATQPQDIPAMLRPMLDTPADVTIVGDLPVEEAIRVTAATLGAIPRAARPAEMRPPIAMPAARDEPFVFRHGGRADQAYYGLVWPLPDFFADRKLSRVADVAAALIKADLVETVRETLGLTYSPQAGASASVELAGLGYLIVQTETPPDKFEAMRKAVLDVIAKLAREPISEDKLDRARKPLVEASQKSRETNGFWTRSLALTVREPRMRDEVLTEPAQLAAVSAQDVQALLSRYVAGKTPITAIAQAR